MTLRRRAAGTPAAPLSDHVAAILLDGWGAMPPKGDNPGFGDGLLAVFMERDEGIARRWREHEAYLRGLARRWGIAPQWGLEDEDDTRPPLFFGESIATRTTDRLDKFTRTLGHDQTATAHRRIDAPSLGDHTTINNGADRS